MTADELAMERYFRNLCSYDDYIAVCRQEDKHPIPEEVMKVMRSYFTLKEKHPNALLLFRVRDFYELYDEDAKIASEVLRIPHFRMRNTDRYIATFPCYALAGYLPRLIRAGHRVDIVEHPDA